MEMDLLNAALYLLVILAGLAVLVGLMLLLSTSRAIIYEYERAILYQNGKFRRILDPGAYFLNSKFHKIYRVDMRRQSVTLPGQEVLSADNISIRASLAATYQVTDPYRAFNNSSNYVNELYLALQNILRDQVGGLAVAELLEKRQTLGETLLQQGKVQAQELGVELLSVMVKDIMFPGDLKNIFAQVVNARLEGQAALERARGETAALRSLANGAKLLDDHPALYQLRLLQALSASANSTIILAPEAKNLPGLAQPGKHKPEKGG
jgi:regulator of protease activity HflC (stomatin/prohibitin superfamily)